MHNAMHTYGGLEVLNHTFLSSTLDGGERFASGSSCFTSEVRNQVPVVQKTAWGSELVWTL